MTFNELVDNYNQAWQNFQWADRDYVNIAILDLLVAESELKAELKERKCYAA
jgi:hypothetical protein